MQELAAIGGDLRTVDIGGIDDRQARPVEAEMAVDERQSATANRAEADHDDRPGNVCVTRKISHGHIT